MLLKDTFLKHQLFPYTFIFTIHIHEKENTIYSLLSINNKKIDGIVPDCKKISN